MTNELPYSKRDALSFLLLPHHVFTLVTKLWFDSDQYVTTLGL